MGRSDLGRYNLGALKPDTVLFAPKTSLIVKVNFVGLLCRVFTHTLGRFALFLSNSIERKFEMK